MTELHVDATAYRLTERQKESMRRLVGGEPDADMLLQMLGVSEPLTAAAPKHVRRGPVLKCVKHNEYKYRQTNGKPICRSCRKEGDARRRAERNKKKEETTWLM